MSIERRPPHCPRELKTPRTTNLQRFFRDFNLDYTLIARLMVRLVEVGEGPWYLTDLSLRLRLTPCRHPAFVQSV